MDAASLSLPVSGEWVSGGFDAPAASTPAPQSAVPRPPARLSIVLPFVAREIPRVLQLLTHMAHLSGQLNRAVYLLPFKGIDFTAVSAAAAKAFADVRVIRDGEGVTSDWILEEKVRNAAGPNSSFRQAAWFFHLNPALGPWLWLESDCLPLAKDWDDRLEAAYRASGKPFMGAGMRWQSGDEYLNGAAIYPRNAVGLAPSLVKLTMWPQFPDKEVAFDVAGGAEVLQKAAISPLFQLEYRSDGEKEPRADAVLFHGDRAGKLIKLLSGPTVENGMSRLPFKVAARKSSKRKRGDAKCAATADPRGRGTRNGATLVPKTPTRQSNGAAIVPVNEAAPAPPTIGDFIRFHVAELVNLSTNANRRTRIIAALRKAKFIRR